MKIEFNPKSIDSSTIQVKKTDPEQTQKPFAQVMAETINATAPTRSKNTGPSPISSLTGVSFGRVDNSIEKPNAVFKTERLLDLLDQYHVHLKDPGVSLRQIEPFTRDIKAKLTDLMAELEKLDPQDPLASILNEAAVMASLEVKKFESGWYNPT